MTNICIETMTRKHKITEDETRLDVLSLLYVYPMLCAYVCMCDNRNVPVPKQHQRAKQSSNLSCSRPFPFILTMSHSIFTGFLTFTGDPNVYPHSIPGRFFLVCWLFGMLILNNTYTASLAGFLTSQTFQETVETIEQVAEQQLRVGTYNSDFPRDQLLEFGISQGQFVTGLESPQDIIDALETGKTDVHIEILPYALNLVANDCGLYITQNGATFSDGRLSWPIQKDHVLYEDLREAFTAATTSKGYNFADEYAAVLSEYKLEVTSGLIPGRAQEDLTCSSTVADFNKLESVGMAEMKGVFYVIFGAGLVAIGMRFISERLRHSLWMEQYFLSTLDPLEQMKRKLKLTHVQN
jgi:hypothetical protein